MFIDEVDLRKSKRKVIKSKIYKNAFEKIEILSLRP